MSYSKLIGMVIVLGLLSGCAGGLNSMQKREYKQFELDSVLVEEKDPGLGAALGILPGGGSFYAREYVYGVINLLLWPASILWDPISGYHGSQSINYDMTVYQLDKKRKKEMDALDDQLSAGDIDNKEYVSKKRKIEDKYDY